MPDNVKIVAIGRITHVFSPKCQYAKPVLRNNFVLSTNQKQTVCFKTK